MKHQQVIFKKPVKVLQVYRMVNEYGKDEKSFADRKEKLVWKPIASSGGYIANGILHLPEIIEQDKKFSNCDLVTIEDEADITMQQEWKLINKRYEKGSNRCFNLHHMNTYEFFGLRNIPLELSLQYDNTIVGDPSRDNFTLATLEVNMPVEVKINGKHDTSRGRYFKEQYYVFHLLGTFDRCLFLTSKDKAVTKTIPSNRKLVDLIKPLW
jgi:hypothetical protein